MVACWCIFSSTALFGVAASAEVRLQTVMEEQTVEGESSCAAASRYPPRPFVEVVPLGDSAVIVRFGDRIDLKVYECVRALDEHLTAHPVPGVLEFTPAFATICLFYDPRCLSFDELCAEVQRIVAGLRDCGRFQPRVVEIVNGDMCHRRGKLERGDPWRFPLPARRSCSF